MAQHIDAHQQQRSIPTASVQSATMQKRHSRAAQPQGKPVSKPQRDRKHTGSAVSKQSAPVRPAAKAKTVQQSEQAPLDGVYYDCQRLRLLPGDLLLHSERLAAHHKRIASAKKPSHAQQQGASTKHNTAVKFLSGAHVVDVLCEHHQKYAAEATGDDGELLLLPLLVSSTHVSVVSANKEASSNLCVPSWDLVAHVDMFCIKYQACLRGDRKLYKVNKPHYIDTTSICTYLGVAYKLACCRQVSTKQQRPPYVRSPICAEP